MMERCRFNRRETPDFLSRNYRVQPIRGFARTGNGSTGSNRAGSATLAWRRDRLCNRGCVCWPFRTPTESGRYGRRVAATKRSSFFRPILLVGAIRTLSGAGQPLPAPGLRAFALHVIMWAATMGRVIVGWPTGFNSHSVQDTIVPAQAHSCQPQPSPAPCAFEPWSGSPFGGSFTVD